MDKSLEELSCKIKTLTFRMNKTNDVIDKRDREALERQRLSVASSATVVNTIKETIEESMFAKGETEEKVKEWSQEVEVLLAEADQCTRLITNELKGIEAAAQESVILKEQQQKLQFEKELTEQRLRQEQESVEEKRKLDLEYHEKLKEAQQSSTPHETGFVKMPKLVITKFDGTPQDWVRFWGQFHAQIDKSNVDPVTKFSYLKELVEIKVRKLIDGLPFTDEGYEKAKSLLEKKYGDSSEVVGAYVRSILELPTIRERDVVKIHNFYETLLYNVESLQTLDSLGKLDAAVRFTVDKLDAIKSELAMTNEDWNKWTFEQFVEALGKWAKNNPVKDSQQKKFPRERGRSFFANRDNGNHTRGCLFCSDENHKALNCDKVVRCEDRKKIFAEKHLCFNCAGGKHRAVDCKSKGRCQTCGGKHHTTICDKNKERKEPGMTANHVGRSKVVHPVVVVRINGYKFRALLDSGASHSYASTTAIDLSGAKVKSTSLRQIAMLTGITTRTMQVYNVQVSSLANDFSLNVNLTKIENRELLSLENPRYSTLIEEYEHLKVVHMDDDDPKDLLPIHLIFGANDYAKIRTGEKLLVGRIGEPVAEPTRFGWAMMSPGAEQETTVGCLAVNSTTDYDNLCSLDILGLADTLDHKEHFMDEFKEQLTRSDDGRFETSLPWKPNHQLLHNNCEGSLRRTNALVRKLRRTNMLNEYDAVIRDQLSEGIVERAPQEVTGKEFYLPHRAVIRENAESTKIRVVYDASARPSETSPSLNDCLLTGPPLHNQLWSVLVRNRFNPVALTGDLRKAFLQIVIREADRDALRFHWIRDLQSTEMEVLRFTRVVFGLTSSPFLLNGVIAQHLESIEPRYPESVAEIRKNLYVDDLISGGPTTEKAANLKRDAVEIFEDAQFHLHKWHSNATELESDLNDGELTFAKHQLNADHTDNQCKLLGMKWNKQRDVLQVDLPTVPAVLTKRGVLAYLAKVYDPLGVISPMLLEGKLVFREICEAKIGWDGAIPDELRKHWSKWESGLPKVVSFPRCIPIYRETLTEIRLHSFGDASKKGVCAAVYAVIQQESGSAQALVTAKSRLAKTNLTIPRLELVAGHMAVNLAVNVRNALQGFKIADELYCWLDSTVALHWLNHDGEYRQFVENRVTKMKSHQNVIWRHVPTAENPADLGSRGGSVEENDLWWNGPTWLANSDRWPPNLVTKASETSEAERKVRRELFVVGVERENSLIDRVLEKFDLRKALRILGWISRFAHNCRHPSEKITGAMTTNEILVQEKILVKRTQQEFLDSEKFKEDKDQLNLQLNVDGVWECHGRIRGEYPIYLPDQALFTSKLVERAHYHTLHGGVGLVMSNIRERYWIPRLRKLVKKVIRTCWGCKRFRAVPAKAPPPGPLPETRTIPSSPFNIIGVDFAGPIKYQKNGREKKSYIVLYTCSLTRAVFLDLLPSLETREFIKSFKRLVARRGRPSVIYSDNGSTFIAASKWLKSVRKDEELNEFLCELSISWRFNLSRAPWWGGQFERLIGVMKGCFYKTVGNGLLSWDELTEVLLDIEIAMNNRPLCYMEEDEQQPTLTPNAMLLVNPNFLPELKPYHEEENLRKRAKYLKKTKEDMWRRWTNEYMRALRERHRLKHNSRGPNISVGDVVLIKSSERNRNRWPMGIVKELIKGKDGVVRAAKLKSGRDSLERTPQHLYPLELSCDTFKRKDGENVIVQKPVELNPNALRFMPKRHAAAEARRRIYEQLRDEQTLD